MFIPTKSFYWHYFPLLLVFGAILNTKSSIANSVYSDTIYKKIKFFKEETITTGAGTKSVLFNNNGSKLYAMNLEAMSVSEIDRKLRLKIKEFKFKATKATGWDYANKTTMESFEEKPVEACFSNNNKILWVSLHNAKGIVPIDVSAKISDTTNHKNSKKVYIKYTNKKKKDSIWVPLIKTGKTPKVIACTNNNSYLLVSNWHGYSVSVLKLLDTVYPYAKVVATIPTKSIPRGIAIDNESHKSYIAIMGSKIISVVDNHTWTIERDIKVASKPRHILLDNQKRLFVSYNSLNKISCINTETGKKLFDATTNAQPRTITLSKNNKFLFVTCYSGNTLDVFKINDSSFTKLYSIESKGKPVGVDLFEDEETIEAWVCNYKDGNIKIFSFKKE